MTLTAKFAKSNEERYERLVQLYEELTKELNQLELEGHRLRRQVQETIDKEKMAEIFKTIHQAD